MAIGPNAAAAVPAAGARCCCGKISPVATAMMPTAAGNRNTEDGLGIGRFVLVVIRVARDGKPESAGLSSHSIAGLDDALVDGTEHPKEVDERHFRLVGDSYRGILVH